MEHGLGGDGALAEQVAERCGSVRGLHVHEFVARCQEITDLDTAAPVLPAPNTTPVKADVTLTAERYPVVILPFCPGGVPGWQVQGRRGLQQPSYVRVVGLQVVRVDLRPLAVEHEEAPPPEGDFGL